MKPETLAELWGLIDYLVASRGYGTDTRKAINAILTRHVEQPVETEEQALSELRAWVNVDGKLRAATLSNVGVKLKDYREDREWFVVEGRNDPAAIREALRLAKELQDG